MMTRKSWLYLFLNVALLFIMPAVVSNAQNDCPSLPKKTWVDTLGYIKTEIPTDPSKAHGIYLGQGIIRRSASEYRPAYIPSNKPTWALAIAHAWNYSRNLVHRVEYPKIGYWMATMVQETELACVTGTTWSTPAQTSNNMANATTNMNHTGCYQIEGPGSAYSALAQAYPYNRFPAHMYSSLMEGPNNQETSSLVKAYYDIYTSQVFNYNVGWDFYQNIDCKRQHDPFAYEKMSASAYNGGPNAFLGAESILNNTGPGCWSGLPATTANYANDIAKWVSVLENTPAYCEYPTGSTFDGYYNENLGWSVVEDYLNIIKIMYPEINFDTQVIPSVRAVFIGQAGAIGNTIPFQQFGPVIDAIILALPLERPTRIEGSPVSGSIGCSGSELPYGHVEILNGSNNMCLGNSVTLELVVDAGGGTQPTYRWYANSVDPANLIGTDKTITLTPSTAGTHTYAAQICNDNGCYTVYSNNTSPCADVRNVNGFQVYVNNCSGCSFIASPAVVNTPCKGMNQGRINLSLTNAPTRYRLSYQGSTPLGPVSGSMDTTGSTISILNLRDGSYNITLEDLNNSGCKAFTNAVVHYTTAVNEYIDASKTQALCLADVAAQIRQLPAPCNWKVQAYVDVFFQWENWVNFGVQTSTGISTLEKYTRTAAKPEIDPWNNVPVSEQILSLNTGDVLDFYIALTNTPGATQQRAYTVKVFDANDVLVHTVVAPVGAAKADAPYHAGSYTVSCPNPIPPAYNLSWSPALTTESQTHGRSTGTVDIGFVTPQVYTVSATHPTNSTCILTDTVIIQPSCPTALPVTLLSFEVASEGAYVKVQWSTIEEKEADYYAIERSTDGVSFETIGMLKAANSSALTEYDYIDYTPYTGTSYYRLRQADFDGSIQYSSIRKINRHAQNTSVYPNPFSESSTLVIASEHDEPRTVQVLDLSGKEIMTENITGKSSWEFGHSLAAGVYLLRVSSNHGFQNYRLVKQ
jgi:hypothetical protein